jgi:hypothetical protein
MKFNKKAFKKIFALLILLTLIFSYFEILNQLILQVEDVFSLLIGRKKSVTYREESSILEQVL